MQTVFDSPVDPQLVERSLAGSAFGSMWLDIPRPSYEQLSGSLTADLVVVGAGYTGLWTALHAAERNPGQKIVVVDAARVGWAASGRNGGFVDASLTHGRANGKARWPNEIDKLEAMGRENLDGMQADIQRLGLDVDWQRTGMLTVATEPHQVAWLREAADDGEGRFLSEQEVRAEVASPTYRAGLFNPDSTAIVHPAKLAIELARACVAAGVQIFEHTNVTAMESAGSGLRFTAGNGSITAERAVLATNVFRSLIPGNRLRTVPVYDYVLSTEPLSDAQLDRIGWANRQGIGDCANQFHYYRLSKDNRIVWGGYDAIYHFGRRVEPVYENRPASYRRLAQHFFITFPQLDDVRFSHRWAGAIDTSTRFCAHWGLARGGRVAYVNGFTGLGVGAARFAADVCLDLLDGKPTDRTELEMVRKRPLPFPPEPLASIGIQATRWSLDRADHNAGRRNLLLRALDALGLGFDS
ncbi:FAD-dependent oxidoreductase [Mycolicibacterium agri]|uniref:Oxidoreductase n=1 Tax=Mycolicibacterium agri TaxID=36811 RepID=A0A2A7N2W4_MYCAG|nr:FAD-dependent oxidoreductase [Mycolicibacterium agri]PEG38097.1 FAD-dependent oxidoreductase [Mycolicibacterium agri]GFG48835.1 oxidoreductase [Mycolicibacterium agri]